MDELLKKLRYKNGEGIVLNPPEGYQLGFKTTGDKNVRYDFVQLFVNTSQELDEWLSKTLPLLKEDAVFWITFPKKSSKVKSDLSRDVLAAKIQETTAYRPVSNVAIDEKWSALRFREKEKVKTKK